MVGKIEKRLRDLGIELPEPSRPGANYVPFVQDGRLVFVTGQLAQWNGELKFIGKLGTEFDLEEGREAVRLAALNVISHLRVAVGGDLDRVERCLRLAVYVNSDPDFFGQSQVANGASDLIMEIFEDAGRHARMAIGVAALPYNVAAEVEGIFKVR